MRLDHLPRVPLCLVADLVAPEEVERLPRPASCRIADVALPRLVLAPFEASAPAKLALACRMLAAGDEPVMQLAPAAGGGR
jgi:HPr kinase/phosphorylase